MFRGLFLTLMYTQNIGIIQIKRKTVRLITETVYPGKIYHVLLTRKQQNMDSGSPPLYSSWGMSFFFTQKTCLPFDVLGA